jgi:hypothetical protein
LPENNINDIRKADNKEYDEKYGENQPNFRLPQHYAGFSRIINAKEILTWFINT